MEVVELPHKLFATAAQVCDLGRIQVVLRQRLLKDTGLLPDSRQALGVDVHQAVGGLRQLLKLIPLAKTDLMVQVAVRNFVEDSMQSVHRPGDTVRVDQRPESKEQDGEKRHDPGDLDAVVEQFACLFDGEMRGVEVVSDLPIAQKIEDADRCQRRNQPEESVVEYEAQAKAALDKMALHTSAIGGRSGSGRRLIGHGRNSYRSSWQLRHRPPLRLSFLSNCPMRSWLPWPMWQVTQVILPSGESGRSGAFFLVLGMPMGWVTGPS